MAGGKRGTQSPVRSVGKNEQLKNWGWDGEENLRAKTKAKSICEWSFVHPPGERRSGECMNNFLRKTTKRGGQTKDTKLLSRRCLKMQK